LRESRTIGAFDLRASPTAISSAVSANALIVSEQPDGELSPRRLFAIDRIGPRLAVFADAFLDGAEIVLIPALLRTAAIGPLLRAAFGLASLGTLLVSVAFEVGIAGLRVRVVRGGNLLTRHHGLHGRGWFCGHDFRRLGYISLHYISFRYVSFRYIR
jgi:hypothetical protein